MWLFLGRNIWKHNLWDSYLTLYLSIYNHAILLYSTNYCKEYANSQPQWLILKLLYLQIGKIDDSDESINIQLAGYKEPIKWWG